MEGCQTPESFGRFQEPDPSAVSAQRFPKGQARLCRAGGLDTMNVVGRSVVLKEFIRDAAKHARDVLFEALLQLFSCNYSPASRLLRLSSIARAVWIEDLHL